MPEPGSFRLVKTGSEFDEVVEQLAVAPRYCFDTEFHREKSYYPRIGLLQIAWDDQLVLLDPLTLDLTRLAPVFTGPGLAIAHAADQDLEVLQRCCGVIPARLFDTQIAAGFLGLSTPSLLSLLDRFLGVDVSKGDRLTDWISRPLTDAQLIYAASDVAYLEELTDKICAELEARGRLEWAEQESDLLRSRGPRQQDPETAWWKLKEHRQLRGVSRGIAQEVAAWRERRAGELDIPARFILSDMAISVIAMKPPKNKGDLLSLRGVEGRNLGEGSAAEILTAVERGSELPADQIRIAPIDDLDKSLRPAVALVSAWISQLAKDLEIDSTLLATRNDLHALLAKRSEPRLATGWRAEVLAEPIRRLIEGEAALAFDGHGQLVLEKRSHESIAPSSRAD